MKNGDQNNLSNRKKLFTDLLFNFLNSSGNLPDGITVYTDDSILITRDAICRGLK